MNKLIGISLILFMFSCKTDQEKVIDIHDLLPVSNSNEADTTDKIKNPYQSELFDFQLAIPEFVDISKCDEKHFLDRFTADTSSSLYLITEQDTTIYRDYVFQDSVRLKGAFFNWLDHLSDGEELMIKDPIKIDRSSAQLFTNDTLIILLTGKRANDVVWKEYFISKGFTDWKYVLRQNAGRKAIWYTMKDKKMIKL